MWLSLFVTRLRNGVVCFLSAWVRGSLVCRGVSMSCCLDGFRTIREMGRICPVDDHVSANTTFHSTCVWPQCSIVKGLVVVGKVPGSFLFTALQSFGHGLRRSGVRLAAWAGAEVGFGSLMMWSEVTGEERGCADTEHRGDETIDCQELSEVCGSQKEGGAKIGR